MGNPYYSCEYDLFYPLEVSKPSSWTGSLAISEGRFGLDVVRGTLRGGNSRGGWRRTERDERVSAEGIVGGGAGAGVMLGMGPREAGQTAMESHEAMGSMPISSTSQFFK